MMLSFRVEWDKHKNRFSIGDIINIRELSVRIEAAVPWQDFHAFKYKHIGIFRSVCGYHSLHIVPLHGHQLHKTWKLQRQMRGFFCRTMMHNTEFKPKSAVLLLVGRAIYALQELQQVYFTELCSSDKVFRTSESWKCILMKWAL